MRAPAPKLRALWPLLTAALGVLVGLALSRPASAADACLRAQEVGAFTALLAVHPETPGPAPLEVRQSISRAPLVAHDREARLVDAGHGQWVERAAGRDPRALPDAAGAQRRDSGAPPQDATPHPRWGSPDLSSSSVAAEVLNRAARTSQALRDARVRGVRPPRGPPEQPLARD
jgi:hypothetical protein